MKWANLCFVLFSMGGEHFGFPKGHTDVGESEEETARRELKEETGIVEIDISNSKSFMQGYTFEKEGKMIDKTVKYFLGFVPNMSGKTDENFLHEINQIKWVNFNELLELFTFQNAKDLAKEVFTYLESIK